MPHVVSHVMNTVAHRVVLLFVFNKNQCPRLPAVNARSVAAQMGRVVFCGATAQLGPRQPHV